MAEPQRDPGIDLNEPVLGVGIDLSGLVEAVFDLNNPVFWEDAHHEAYENRAPELPDLNQNVGDDLNQHEAGVNLNGFEEDGAVSVRRTRKQYSDGKKRAVYKMLLEGSVGGRLPDGLSLRVSSAMNVSRRCVQRIWKDEQRGGGIHSVANKRAKNCGRKRIEVKPEAIAAIPFKDRTTLEDLARGLGWQRTTIFRRLKEGKIEGHLLPSSPR
ncbi:hypothetical protein HU200_052167 [Digitaria exilis]|uniref:DUF7769 domain-containing protein n=1 Tax=Digitaria exilis TaxID=1010633 RepID=A0A835APW8_9POAL|nr:hypothetical protein HU200_052167 [Digitaria exilis]